MTICEENQTRIEKQIRGALDPEGARQLEDHEGSCPACRAYRETVRRTGAALAGVVQDSTHRLDLDAIRDRLRTARRRYRTAFVAIAAIELLPLPFLVVFLPFPWYLPALPVALGLVLGAGLWCRSRIGPLVRGEEREGEVFEVFRRELDRSIAASTRGGPLLMVLGLFLAGSTLLDLTGSPLHRALAVTGAGFELLFVLSGIHLLARVPALRRERAELLPDGESR